MTVGVQEDAPNVASSMELELIQVAADGFSSGLAFIMLMLMAVLFLVSADAGMDIAGSPAAWAVLVLHWSCLRLCGCAVKLTASRASSVGLCWQMLAVMCVVLPPQSTTSEVSPSNFFLVLVPASTLLLDYRHSVGLSFASTAASAWWHWSSYAQAVQYREQRIVFLLMWDCMAFFAAASLASALEFWKQQNRKLTTGIPEAISQALLDAVRSRH